LLAGVLAVVALASLPASSTAAECLPPYCPSPPSPPPAEGKVKVSPKATVKRGRAPLRLTCTGGGPCKGTVKLTAKIKKCKKGKKCKQCKKGRKCRRSRKVVIAKVPFNLATGASKTVKVKLSRAVMKELKKRKKLKARAAGPGVISSKVKVKLKKKHKARHSRMRSGDSA